MRSLLRRTLTLCAILLLAFPSAYAQQRLNWCATDAHTARLRATFHDPALEAQRAAAEMLSAQLQADDLLARSLRPRSGGRIVPTVIHVVTPCGATGVTKQQILAGFRLMQQDWLRLNPDTGATRSVFKPYAAGLDLEFRLAQLDPQGNPTDGIHRVTSKAQSTADGADPVKDAVPYWPTCFNIWLVPSIGGGSGTGTILGYGQFPGTGPWNTWGFVMRADSWTGAFGANNRTASHEVGHCFNLYHSFTDGGGCGSGPCTASGDGVCDTPPHASATQGCSQRQNTCANDVGPGSPYTTNVVDQIENFMSYDDCQNMFTRGQKARVDAAMQQISFLQNLVSPANQLATGVADGQVVPPPAPVAYINTCRLSQTGGSYLACQGQPITLTDVSYGTSIVSRRWTFSNATPATDTSASPTVVFNSPGRQTITLTVLGVGGLASAPLTLEVQVLPRGSLVAPFRESFEAAGIDTVFHVISSSAVATVRRWQVVTPTVLPGLVASDGQAAFQLPNASIPMGTVSTLLSPTFDTRGLPGNLRAYVKFDIAYALRNAASADELRVSLSKDCGRTWLQRYQKSGSALSTNGVQNLPNFVPTTASQWRTDSIPLINQFLNQAAVMIKFEAITRSVGNNLYLDNLRIESQSLGLTADLAAAGIALAPNPLTPETAVRLTLSRPTRVSVRIRDLLGRRVLADIEQTLTAGVHELPLGQRLGQPGAGIYVVTITLDGQPYTQKLLVR